MKKLGLLIFGLLAILAQLAMLSPVQAVLNFNDGAFGNTWNRVDKPVQDLPNVGRGFVWGPQAPGSDAINTEPYDNVSRKVQYFDKARMEINNFRASPNDLFYVTTGLLVKELITGLRQDGDYVFKTLQSSTIQVAGDPNDGVINSIAPTYASFRNVATVFGKENGFTSAIGSAITAKIDKDGVVTTISPPEQRLIKSYSELTQHNVADVFVDFSTQNGQVWDGSKFVDGPLFFGNPTYVMGLPITDPYWTRAVVSGVERDVLVQMFERRVLTYTPSNADPNKVEMGNVGQHYYKWRYILNGGTAPIVATSMTALAGTPQTAPISVTFGVSFKVVVKNNLGNGMPGLNVKFTALASGPTGTFPNNASSATVTTDADGVATAPAFTANNTSGDYILTATTPNVPGTVNFKLTNTPGAPTTITTLAGTPQNIKVKVKADTNLKALVKDAFNNPVPGVSITFSAPASGISATWITGTSQITTTVTTDSAGIGTAPDLVANCSLGNFNIQAITSGIPTAALFPLSNVVGDPSQVNVAGGGNQTTKVNTVVASPLQALVGDACGDPLPNVTVNFTAPQTGASAIFTGTNNVFQAITTDKGIATSAVLQANTIAGGFAVVGQVNKVNSTASFKLTNSPDAPVSISTSSGSNQYTIVSTNFATVLKALATDIYGNPVPGATVVFAPPATGPSAVIAGNPTVTTDSSGIATSPLMTANCFPGSFITTATLSPLPTNGTPTNFVLTNNPGLPANITATSGGGQATVVNTAFAKPLAATVTDSCNNPVPDVQITYQAPSTAASVRFAGAFTTQVATTDQSGVASSPVLIGNTVSGAYSVVATLPFNGKTASFQLTNNPGAPATLTVLQGNSQQTLINTVFAVALKVQVNDTFGNGVPGSSLTFLAPSAGASGSFSNGTSVSLTSDVQGIVTSPGFTANATAGAYNVTASVSGAGIQNILLSNTSGIPASITIQAGSDQTAVVNSLYPQPLKVLVKDAGQNVLTGVQVNFQAPINGTTNIASATFSGGASSAIAATDAGGVATSPALTANSVSGNYKIVASVVGVNSTASFNLISTPSGVASIQVVQGSDQTARVGATFAIPIQVKVQDANGNPVSGQPVTLTGPDPAQASVNFQNNTSSTTATTDAAGLATVSNFAANCQVSTGSYTVVASVPKVGSATVNNLNNTVGSPSLLTVSGGSGQSVKINQTYGGTLQAKVTDSCKNSVPQVQVTFTAPSSGPTASFNGTSSTIIVTSDASGLVTTSPLIANGTPGSFAINATLTGGSVSASAVSFNLSNLSGDPVSIVSTGGTPQSTPVGFAFNTKLEATVRDANQNPVQGVIVTFAGPTDTSAPGGLPTTPQATTDVNGKATTQFAANTHAGSYNVTASISGATANFALTNLAGTVAKVNISGNSNLSAVVNTDFSSPLVFQAQDSYGNPVPGVQLTFAAPANGPTGNFKNNNPLLTDTGGKASMGIHANTQAGSYDISATAVGTSASGVAHLTNQAGVATVISTTNSTLAYSAQVNTAFADLQVKLLDAYNNPVPSTAVTFTGPLPTQTSPRAPGAFLESTQGSSVNLTSDSNGLATLQSKANSVSGSYQVVASVANVSPPVTFQMTNLPGPASSVVVFAGSPQSAQINSAFQSTLQARVLDADQNPVPGVPVTFLAPTNKGAGAVFSGNSPVSTDQNGVASASTLTANGLVGSYDVLTSVSNVGTQADFKLTNTNGPPASILTLSGATQATQVGTAFSTLLQVQVFDAGNNPVPGVGISVTPPANGASASVVATNNQTVTAADGTMTFAATANCTVGGPYQVSMTTKGTPQPAVFQLTNQLGKAVNVTAVSGPTGGAKVQTNFAGQLIALVTDGCNNPVSGTSVTFSASSTSGKPDATFGSAATVKSDASGMVMIQPVAGCTIKNYSVTAQISGGLTSATYSLNNLLGDPAQIVPGSYSSASPTNVTIGTTLSPDLVAVVGDACGNPEPNVTVSWTAAANSTSPGLNYPNGNTANTGLNGQASVQAAANCALGGPYNVFAQFTNQPSTVPTAQYIFSNTAPSGFALQPVKSASFTLKSDTANYYYATPDDLAVKIIGCGTVAQSVTWTIISAPSPTQYNYDYFWQPSTSNGVTGPKTTDANGLANPDSVAANGQNSQKFSFLAIKTIIFINGKLVIDGNVSGATYIIRANIVGQSGGYVDFVAKIP